jgi:hypothetical protein
MAGSRVRVLEDGGVVREEHPDGTVMIMDYTQRRLLQLDPATKEAIQGTMSGSDLSEGQSVLALFRDRITAADGAFVGRVSLGDMEAHEYRFSFDDSDAAVTVWVTPESSLPLKAMVQGPEWLPVRETIFAEFDWNPTFEAGQMTLDVPSGYTIDTLQTIDRAMTTFAEQRRACTAALACGTCLTEFLAIYADCFQGRFPDGLDAVSTAALASVFTYEHRSADTPPPPWFPSNKVRRRWHDIETLSTQLACEEERAGLTVHRSPDPTFLAVAYAWASGEGFAELVAEEELTGGDFVRTMRQLVDLLRQLAQVAPWSRHPGTYKISTMRCWVAFAAR